MFGMDLGEVGSVIITIVMLIFAIIVIFAPIWLYLGHVYARECRDQLREIKELLEQGVSEP